MHNYVYEFIILTVLLSGLSTAKGNNVVHDNEVLLFLNAMKGGFHDRAKATEATL